MAADDDVIKKYLSDEDPKKLWERVQVLIREQGDDPAEVLARAAANVAAWRALPPEESLRQRRASIREWLAWESTVDDMGNTLKLSEEELERRRQEAVAAFDADEK